jgi:hypothetical protein
MMDYAPKRKKFIELFRCLDEFNRMFSNTKLDTYERMFDKMNEQQKKIYKELSDLYWNNRNDDYSDFKSNNPIYDKAITDTIQLMRELLESFVNLPVTYRDGKVIGSYDDFFKRFDDILNLPEWDEIEFGSNFTMVWNGHIIKKIDLQRDEEGYMNNHIYGTIREFPIHVFPMEIQLMSRGLYVIDGYRFDIWNKYDRKIKINVISEYDNSHPILKYVDKQKLEEYYKAINEEYVSCHRCGDGGCPSCKPNWFI